MAISTEKAQEIIKKIKDLGIYQDALNCKEDSDIQGLIYIINMAENRPGHAEMKLGEAFAIMHQMEA